MSSKENFILISLNFAKPKISQQLMMIIVSSRRDWIDARTKMTVTKLLKCLKLSTIKEQER
jgi:hypothetical protein